jgi:hypothetical protein
MGWFHTAGIRNQLSTTVAPVPLRCQIYKKNRYYINSKYLAAGSMPRSLSSHDTASRAAIRSSGLFGCEGLFLGHRAEMAPAQSTVALYGSPERPSIANMSIPTVLWLL